MREPLVLKQATVLFALTRQPQNPSEIFSRIEGAYFPLLSPVVMPTLYEHLRGFSEKGFARASDKFRKSYALTDLGRDTVTDLLIDLGTREKFSGEEILFLCAACLLWSESTYEVLGKRVGTEMKFLDTKCHVDRTASHILRCLSSQIYEEHARSKNNLHTLGQLEAIRGLLENAMKTKHSLNRIPGRCRA